MVTFAILLNKDVVKASHCDPATGEAELVRFPPDGKTSLSTEFHVSNGQIVPITLADTEAEHDLGKNIGLNVDDDGMTLSITGAGEETGITIDDLLLAICSTVLGTDETATDKKLVWVADENPRLKRAATRAGFNDVDFILPTDAAIREWQHVWGVEVEASDVVVLTVNSDGIFWELRVADDHGYFLSPPDIPNCGQFVPATITAEETEANLGKGLARFFEWNRIHGSRNIILTGNGTRTEGVTECISLLQVAGHDVFMCENAAVLLGASKTAIPSRYERLDAAASRLLSAKSEGNLDQALRELQAAETIFLCETERFVEAEELAIAASFMDPKVEVECLAKLAEVMPRHDAEVSPQRIRITIDFASWKLRRNTWDPSSPEDIALYCRENGLIFPWHLPTLADLLPGAIQRWQDDGDQTLAMWESCVDTSGGTEGLVKKCKRILGASGETSEALLPYLRAEANGLRLKKSLLTLSTLLAGISDLDEEPYSDLQFKILTVIAVHLEMYYSSVDEALWLRVTDNVERVINHVLERELQPEIYEEAKSYLTWWEKIRSRLGEEYTVTVTRYTIDVPVLVQIYVVMYRFLHELENIREEMVADEFAKQNVVDAINDDNFQALKNHFAEVWFELFRAHHPSAAEGLGDAFYCGTT